MTQTICILGRQPAIGVAELESLYGPSAIMPVGSEAVLVSHSSDQIPLARLGGTLKLGKFLAELPYTDWQSVIKYIIDALPAFLPFIPEGKIRMGLSVHGFNVTVPVINRSGLEIKKVIRDYGRSVRVVPNKQPSLNTAQTIHNQLTGQLGMELAVIRSGNKTVLAQIIAVQDISAYAARDQARPKRDAQVGMLPPKLAQIIINLASGRPIKSLGVRSQSPGNTKNQDLQPKICILDPFCGTGVILQEATLMGLDVFGSDNDPRMVEYAKANIDWLRQQQPELTGLATIQVADATSFGWPGNITTLASEVYLGRPFTQEPSLKVVTEVSNDVNTITRKFLNNLAAQTQSGFRLALALPAWKVGSNFKHLGMLDQLDKIGYTRISFKHVSDEDLIYHRPGQIVARELVVFQRL